MGKQLRALKTLLAVTLAFGIATPASAAHCDAKKGDSMWRIAKRYHVDFHRLLELNRHYPNQHLIHPKDEVNLPDGSHGHTADEPSHSDEIENGNEQAPKSEASSQAQAVLDLVNKERAKQGLKALKLDTELNSVATLKAKDMRDKNYFSHDSPTYGSPFEMMQKFGIEYRSAGENIAAGQRSAEQVMNDWMNSSGHRANILNADYTLLGVGYAEGGSYGTYWVQEFSRP